MERPSRRTKPGESAWCEARLALEIEGPIDEGRRTILIARPFAVIGRAPGADLRIEDGEVGSRHAYMIADHRGVFVVDLASRTGTRFDGAPARSGWLSVGDSIEIAGRTIRLVSLRIDGRDASPPPCRDDLLAASDADSDGSTFLLEPAGLRGRAWVIASPLTFIGRGDACGLRLNQADIARVHCSLYRSEGLAYLIEMPGRPTPVNRLSPRGAVALDDGDQVEIGRSRFIARIAPLGRAQKGPKGGLPALNEPGGHSTSLVPQHPGEPQVNLVLGALMAGQAELLRRQAEMQAILDDLTAAPGRAAGGLSALPAPGEEPIDVDSTPTDAPPPPASTRTWTPPLPTEPIPPRSIESAVWLIGRIDEVKTPNRFSWRSIVGRVRRRRDDGGELPADDTPQGGESSTTDKPPDSPQDDPSSEDVQSPIPPPRIDA